MRRPPFAVAVVLSAPGFFSLCLICLSEQGGKSHLVPLCEAVAKTFESVRGLHVKQQSALPPFVTQHLEEHDIHTGCFEAGDLGCSE